MKKILELLNIFIFISLLILYFFPISFKRGVSFCAQVLVTACHTITGECREFANSCSLPYFWEVK